MATTIVDGLGFPESLRWFDGALWFADWAAGRVWRTDRGGVSQVVAQRDSFPLCFAPVAAREVLLVSNSDRAVLRAGHGDPVRHADLSGHGEHLWNDCIAAADGTLYVGNLGFDMAGGVNPATAGPVGSLVAVRPDGTVTRVADGLAFPNGMALIDGGATLLVAESWGSRLTAFRITAVGGLADRRVWAETPGLHPDGIDVAADGTVWLADVGTRSCVRVAEGGRVLDRIELPRGAFDCVLGDLGEAAAGAVGGEAAAGAVGGEAAAGAIGGEAAAGAIGGEAAAGAIDSHGPTLYVAVNEFGGDPTAGSVGQILAVPVG